jgi:hypothetical protein
MAKVKFDVSGSDPKDAFKGGAEQPKPGAYNGKIVQCKVGAKQGDPDNKRLEVIVEITDKKNKGARLYDYIAFSEASQWKMDQFLQVLGVSSKSKRKGTFDTDDVVGESVKIRVAGDTYNGEYKAKLAAYLPRDEDDDEDDDIDVDEDDEEIEDDEESDDDEEEEEEEESDEDEDEDEVAPYEEWDIEELKAECKARKLKIKPGSKKPTYVKALEADDDEGGDDDEDEDEEDPF